MYLYAQVSIKVSVPTIKAQFLGFFIYKMKYIEKVLQQLTFIT